MWGGNSADRTPSPTSRKAQGPTEWAVRAWHIRRELRGTPLQKVTAEGFVPFVNLFSPSDAEEHALRIARRFPEERDTIKDLGQHTLSRMHDGEIIRLFLPDDGLVKEKTAPYLPRVHVFRIGESGTKLREDLYRTMNSRDHTDPTAGYDPRIIIPVAPGVEVGDTEILVAKTFEATQHLTSPILVQSGPFEGVGRQEPSGKVVHNWPLDIEDIYPNFYRTQ